MSRLFHRYSISYLRSGKKEIYAEEEFGCRALKEVNDLSWWGFLIDEEIAIPVKVRPWSFLAGLLHEPFLWVVQVLFEIGDICFLLAVANNMYFCKNLSAIQKDKCFL